VFLELHAITQTLRISSEDEAFRPLLFEHLRKHFPDMRMRAISDAMACADNRVFPVWSAAEAS
jgi:hypothetical protein